MAETEALLAVVDGLCPTAAICSKYQDDGTLGFQVHTMTDLLDRIAITAPAR